MDPIGSFSGIASGIQWRDMVDQIMLAEAARRLAPVTSQATAQQKRVDAWNSYNTLVSRLNDAAKRLRDGAAFSAYGVTVGSSSSTGRGLLTATASAGAAPGSHKVEVVSLARAEKLSGAVAADPSSALGISGEFVVNGKRVEISATDSLNAVRDRINAANTGTPPSGVTATILSSGPNSHRLVLNADHTGAAGIDLVDGASGALRQLGFVDGTLEANTTASGATRSQRFTSTTSAIATMMGITLPPPATVKVGGKTISVDLSTDSLATIAARIQAAGGTATTVSETVGGVTTHRLEVGGTVSADDEDGMRTLEALGLMRGGRGAVAQSVATGSALTGADGEVAATATLLTDLGNGGSAGGVSAGDTFTLRGTRADGTAVSLTYTVTGTDTVQDLLDRINGPDGFGRPGSPGATATFENGRIRITDAAGGDSRLGFSLIAGNENGGSLTFGPTATDTVGRLRSVVEGSDARLRVDGVLLTRPGNTVTDALSGVTLNLQQAEPGNVVDVTVSRDVDGIVNSLKSFATAYNALVDFQRNQTATGGPLARNATLRSTLAAFTGTMLTDVAGLGTTEYRRATVAGVSLTRTGTLEVDEAKLKGALANHFADVKALFGSTGRATDGEVYFVNTTGKSQPGSYAVVITDPATRAVQTGSGFSGVYSGAGSADTLTVTDASTGKTGSIRLAEGDTTEDIAGRLNALFQAQGMKLTAAKDGSELSISSGDFGSAAGFTLAFSGGEDDAPAQLGLAAGTYRGTDVRGTLGGHEATGLGQVLSGAAGSPAEGISVKYSGSTARAAGEVAFSLGVGGMMARAAETVIRAGDGTVATQVDSLQRSVTSLNSRAEDIQKRLDMRRNAMILQFTAMEAALGRIQSQGNWLTTQISALYANR